MKIITTALLLIFLFSFVVAPAGSIRQSMHCCEPLCADTGIDDLTISGTVLDANSSAPVAAAKVAIEGSNIETLTTPDGKFSLTLARAARMILQCTAAGYEPYETTVIPGSGSVVIRLRPQAGLSANSGDLALVLESSAAERVATANAAGRARRIIYKTSPRQTGQPAQPASPARPAPYSDRSFNTEGYDAIQENRFLSAIGNPLSTFSIDVDAASYSNVRRLLRAGQLPPAGSVRIEELINYFPYQYPEPEGEHPFAIHTEIAGCPWNTAHTLVRIGLQGKKMPVADLPAANLVFLIDVSGSMMSENKLPLVKSSMKLLVDQLREQDRVAIVVYAGSAGLVLPAISATQSPTIREAIDRLEAGGSTAGGEGIRLAYRVARENLRPGGNNRVILCTDGDFNVGASSDAEMERMITEERASGIYLTVLGYGMGNYKDNKMQKLANKGNGNHAYIDNLAEARKVLVNEFGGTLFTIANDVKLQVEFNPALVQAYRLIGYENRMLRREDFNDDKKDAGELGSGHTVTALYEIVPVGVKTDLTGKVDTLKYQRRQRLAMGHSEELMTIKFRYKKPGEHNSRLIEQPVAGAPVPMHKASGDFRFAAAVAAYGMLLSNSEFAGEASFQSVGQLAGSALGDDRGGYRREFVELVRAAARLKAELTHTEGLR